LKAKKGDWVQVYRVVLEAGERAPQVPEDTAKVPLEMKVKEACWRIRRSLGTK
jgi:sulfur transfer protein SufE